MPTPLALNADTPYWVLLRPTFSVPFGGHYEWFMHGAGSLDPAAADFGMMNQKTFMNYNSIGGYTMDMQIVGNPAAVPEPSTYAALFGLAALGFAADRRRRRQKLHREIRFPVGHTPAICVNPVALSISLVARLVAVIFVFPVLRASGQTVLVSSNLGNLFYDSYLVGGSQVSGGPYWAAESFTTGSSSTFSLADVTLLIGNPAPAFGGTNGGFSVSLYDDSSSQPGSPLATLSGSANPATPGPYAYSASGVTMSADTTYWIIAQAGTDSAYSWSATRNLSQSGWAIGDLRGFSSNGGIPGWSIANGSTDGVLQFSENERHRPIDGAFRRTIQRARPEGVNPLVAGNSGARRKQP